jgi:hypothetical protein
LIRASLGYNTRHAPPSRPPHAGCLSAPRRGDVRWESFARRSKRWRAMGRSSIVQCRRGASGSPYGPRPPGNQRRDGGGKRPSSPVRATRRSGSPRCRWESNSRRPYTRSRSRHSSRSCWGLRRLDGTRLPRSRGRLSSPPGSGSREFPHRGRTHRRWPMAGRSGHRRSKASRRRRHNHGCCRDSGRRRPSRGGIDSC